MLAVSLTGFDPFRTCAIEIDRRDRDDTAPQPLTAICSQRLPSTTLLPLPAYKAKRTRIEYKAANWYLEILIAEGRKADDSNAGYQ